MDSNEDDEIVLETDQEDSEWVNGAETEDDEENEPILNLANVASQPMVWRQNSPFAPDVREFVPFPSQVKDSQLNELLKENPTPFELL